MAYILPVISSHPCQRSGLHCSRLWNEELELEEKPVHPQIGSHSRQHLSVPSHRWSSSQSQKTAQRAHLRRVDCCYRVKTSAWMGSQLPDVMLTTITCTGNSEAWKKEEKNVFLERALGPAAVSTEWQLATASFRCHHQNLHQRWEEKGKVTKTHFNCKFTQPGCLVSFFSSAFCYKILLSPFKIESVVPIRRACVTKAGFPVPSANGQCPWLCPFLSCKPS